MVPRPVVVPASVLALLLASALGAGVAAAQGLTIRSEVLLFGDDTEFHNPFREGETLLGASARLLAAIDLGERATLTLGGVGSLRFGSEEAFDEVKPLVSLTVRSARSSFVFGTLPGPTIDAPIGPDRAGPHDLLPPLQRETLSYERPYEAGLAWTFAGTSLRHALWLNWQRLNTAAHRERIDAGGNASVRLSSHVSVPIQFHVVHEGGQLYASGPVADSAALAAGVDLRGTVATGTRASLELFGLMSRYVPDRSQPGLDRDGVAFFGRATVERAGWRGHLIVWRGRHFIKDEGDPNYLPVRRDGSRYGGTRDYSEVGLARRFSLAPSAVVEVSARGHRIERHYEYSFRVTSIVTPAWRIR